MTVMNDIDRFHLVLDVLKRLKSPQTMNSDVMDAMNEKLSAHKKYIYEYGKDMPEILDWKWDRQDKRA